MGYWNLNNPGGPEGDTVTVPYPLLSPKSLATQTRTSARDPVVSARGVRSELAEGGSSAPLWYVAAGPPRRFLGASTGFSGRIRPFSAAHPRWLRSDPLSAWWLGLAPATLEFWVRFPNERNQGKQAHPVLKYRVPHGSQTIFFRCICRCSRIRVRLHLHILLLHTQVSR